MNQSVLACIATLLLLCDIIYCGPIQITVSDNSVYTNTDTDANTNADDKTYSGELQKDEEPPKQQEEDYLKISLLEPIDKTRESVNLEYEAIPSKVLTKYDSGHKKLADFSQPIPIIDSISEKEKYGNNGDQFDGIARAIVNGYEAFSNLINKLIGKPKDLARSISRGITAQLDVIGGKLVGL